MKTITHCKTCLIIIKDKNCMFINCSKCPFRGDDNCKFNLIIKAGEYLFDAIKELGAVNKKLKLERNRL
jgi:hypothetical protein